MEGSQKRQETRKRTGQSFPRRSMEGSKDHRDPWENSEALEMVAEMRHLFRKVVSQPPSGPWMISSLLVLGFSASLPLELTLHEV